MFSLWPWKSRHDTDSRSQHIIWSCTDILGEILPGSNMTVRFYGLDFGFWFLIHRDIDLGDTTVGQGNDIPFMDNNCPKYYPDQPGCEVRFWLCVHCDLTLGHGHDIPLYSWVTIITHPWIISNIREILSRSNMAVRSYSSDKDLGSVFTWHWPWNKWPWVKVVKYPLAMDINYVKYYVDPIGQ